MLQQLRQHLTLALLTLLPFHAFLVTVGTKLLEGPGNAPMTILALWKEVTLLVILLIAFFELFKRKIRFDRIDAIIICLIALGVLVSLYHSAFSLPGGQAGILHSPFFFGFKYDFVPLIAFFILRRVPWSDAFIKRLFALILIVGGILSVYGVATLFLPQTFFSWLGYSDLHSLYQPNASLSAFAQIGGTGIRRIQSTMSGANQLGIWLLIPFSLLLVHKQGLGASRWGLGQGIVLSAALLLTLSRSAWIGAAVMAIVALWQALPRRKFYQTVSVLFCIAIVLLFAIQTFAPAIVGRAASTAGHIDKPIEAVRTMIAHPLGLGLGAAGPASNRSSDTCVHLAEGDDPSWAAAHPSLCVFKGTTQVQPLDRPCDCPFLTENWYLQIGVEMGIIGFVLYVMLIACVLRKLQIAYCTLQSTFAIFLAFLGVSVAALFLHAWEDAAVAYTVWILVAISLQSTRFRRAD